MAWLWASEGEMQYGSSLGSGQSGRDVDEVATQGGATGEGVSGRAGDGAGGAEQIVGNRGEHGPGRVGGERAGGLVCPRTVDEVGPDLLADGVVAVGDVGLVDWLGVVREE